MHNNLYGYLTSEVWLNHWTSFSQGMCHEIATRYCHKRPDLGLLLIMFPGLKLQMPFGRCQHIWTAPDSQYLVVPPYICGVGAETLPWGQWDIGSIQSCWPSSILSQQFQRCTCPYLVFIFHRKLWQSFWQTFRTSLLFCFYTGWFQLYDWPC